MHGLEERWRTAIEKAAATAPRYLFRAWSSRSGCHEGLNTPAAITPLAFSNGQTQPKSIYDMTSTQLRLIWNEHYNGSRNVRTVFSSWGHSLSFVLCFAQNLGESAHVSIIDTKRLPACNIALHTDSPDLKTFGLVGGDHEFLVFGVVHAHKAVPLSVFDGHATPRTYQLVHTRWDLRPEIYMTMAKTASEAFGIAFALPILCYLVAVDHRSVELLLPLAQKMLSGDFCFYWPWIPAKELAAPERRFPEKADAYRVLRELMRRYHISLTANLEGTSDVDESNEEQHLLANPTGDDTEIDGPEGHPSSEEDATHGEGIGHRDDAVAGLLLGGRGNVNV